MSGRRKFLFQTFQSLVVLSLGNLGKAFARAKPNDTSNVRSKNNSGLNVQTNNPEEFYDCLILGAGLSGMTAANILAFPRVNGPLAEINSKPRSVLVLEARDRLGGRLFTQYHKDFPEAVELGAQYIHVDDTTNFKGKRFSLWQALTEFKIATTEVHRLYSGVAFSRFFSSLRKHWQIVFELPLLWLLNFRDEIKNYRGKDMSLRQWLDFGPRVPYDQKQKPIVDIYLSGASSGTLDDSSLQGFNLDHFYSLDEGDYEYKINSGWVSFIKKLLQSPDTRNTLHLSKAFGYEKIPVKFNTQVTKIHYFPDHVEVSVREHIHGHSNDISNDKNNPSSNYIEKTYFARTAIITFPIAILRRAAGIDAKNPNDLLEFFPPLPEKKVQALKVIGIGVAAKMFINFESNFWGEDISLINRVDGKSKMGRTYFVPQFGSIHNNTVIGAYLGGQEALEIITLTEEEVLSRICAELGEIFADANKEKIILQRVKLNSNNKKIYLYKHWAHDPWSYGNDSYLRFVPEDSELKNILPTARYHLASPAQTGALHWAGEATVYEDTLSHIYTRAHAGVTHGAHTSGLRAAKEVNEFLNRLLS